MAAPVRPHFSRPPSQAVTASVLDPPSASSSLAGNSLSRSDQIIYRYYVKTIEVLAEARVAQPNGNGGKGKEKKDKWVRQRRLEFRWQLMRPVQPRSTRDGHVQGRSEAVQNSVCLH